MKKIVILFVAFYSLTAVSQEVLLKFNYQKGDVYLVKLEMNQNLGLMGGIDMSAEMKMNIKDVKVLEITAESKIQKMQVDVLQSNSTIRYGTEMKEEDLDAKQKELKTQFDPMMKAVVTQTFNRQGKTISTKVVPQTPGMESFGQRAEYPKTSVKVGSTWNVEVSDNTTGVIKMIYTVSEINGGKVLAAITGTASGLPGSKITGNTIIDIATGNPDVTNVLISVDVQGSKITVGTKVVSTKI